MIQIRMKKSLLAAGVGIGAALAMPTAFAVPLTGLLMVAPGFADKFVTSDGSTVSGYAGGSYFHMNNKLNIGGAITTGALLKPGKDGGVLLGQYQRFIPNPDEPHPQGWQGDTNDDGILEGAAGAGYATGAPPTQAKMLLPFSFFGAGTYMGTNPVSYQSGESHPAPSADVDMSTCVANVCDMTLEISALEVFWNGSVFEQGPRPDNTGSFVLAKGTYNLDTKFYSITWDSHIKNGPFNGVHGFWHLEGTHVVPVPAAVWLFGSGLIGLAGLGRCRLRKQS